MSKIAELRTLCKRIWAVTGFCALVECFIVDWGITVSSKKLHVEMQTNWTVAKQKTKAQGWSCRSMATDIVHYSSSFFLFAAATTWRPHHFDILWLDRFHLITSNTHYKTGELVSVLHDQMYQIIILWTCDGYLQGRTWKGPVFTWADFQ